MRTSMILIGALMISSVIFAQTKDKRHHDGEGRADKLKSELLLNDTQYASIKGINKKYAEQFSKLRKDSTAKKNEKRAEMMKLRGAREKEINAVLTPDQKTKLEKLKLEKRENKIAQRKQHAEDRQAKFAKELSLTDDQIVKVKDANKQFAEKAGTLRKAGTDKSKNKEEFKKLRKDHEATMQSILTTEQFAKWKEMRKSNHKHGRNGKQNR